MIKIKLTHVKFSGECEIKGSRCTAGNEGEITAVFDCQNGSQINVCEQCLKAKIAKKEWETEPVRVEPSHVVMWGICDVRTDVCSAKDGGPVTAVWTFPGRNQVNVCNDCYEKKKERGEWTVTEPKNM
jgi:hypothetical protein